MIRRDALALAGALLVGSGLSGCAGRLPLGASPDDALLPSGAERETAPDVDAETTDALARDIAAFTFDLHRRLRERDPGANLFSSPFGASIALAMTYLGARGETAEQMREALRFSLGDGVHPAFNALELELAERAAVDGDGDAFELDVANALWGREGYPFDDAYLDALATHYGAGMRALDFADDPDGSRRLVNRWVADETNDRIPELLPEGALDADTRFVLTNAVYFLADWAHQFEADATRDREFAALDGSISAVPTMRQIEVFPYAEVDGHQVADLPYVGEEVSMTVLLPAAGEFEAVEESLDADRFAAFVDALEEASVDLSLPKFAFRNSTSLREALSSLGMTDAFDPRAADFGGMVEGGDSDLFVEEVYHDAFVAVDEEGTEAAAATAVVGGSVEAPMAEVRMAVDRPFLFAIRDRSTGAILFFGRIADAAAAN